jgi:beta-galactosidase
MTQARVTVGRGGLELSGATRSHLPLLAGGMDYFGVPRAAWDRCLDAVVDLGLPMVSAAVPWALHEAAPAVFDFGDGERDLEGFLAACAARGLRVLLRLGPAVGAELNGFGLPERVLRDERCLALGARGNRVLLPLPPRTFPLPSYAAEAFLAEAETWLRAVGAFLAPRRWPDGPVVAAQLDAELFFLRAAAYDQDYCDDAVARYRRFLVARYPDGLPAGYRGARVAELHPPRRFEVASDDLALLAPHLDWVASREQMILDALARLTRALRDAGLQGVPVLTTLPVGGEGGAAAGAGSPAGLPAVERCVDIAALRPLVRRRDDAAVKRAALLLDGSSRLPTLELECGARPWWFPQTAAAQRSARLLALMHGVRGLTVSMAVDRERWMGAAIGVDGAQRRDRFESAKQLLAALQRVSRMVVEREAPVAVLRLRDAERLALCASLLDPAPPALLSLLGLGTEELVGDERARRYARALAAAEAALTAPQIPYAIVDAEAGAARLQRYRLVVVPGLELADAALRAALEDCAACGGRVVVIESALSAAAASRGSEAPGVVVVAIDALAATLRRELEALAWRGPTTSDPEVELALHRGAAGREPALLFLASHATTERRVAIAQLAPELRAHDALTGAPVDLAAVRLEAHQVRMILLEGATEAR